MQVDDFYWQAIASCEEKSNRLSTALSSRVCQQLAGSKVVTALPTREVMIKRITLPRAWNDYQIEHELSTNLRHYVSVPADDLMIDFVRDDDPSEHHQTVLLMASKRSRLQQYSDTFQQAGLTLECISVVQVAMTQAWPLLAQQISTNGMNHHGLYIYLSLSEHDGCLHVFEGGKHVYAHVLDVPVTPWLQSIHQQLPLEPTNRLSAQVLSTVPPNHASDALIMNIQEHINQALRFLSKTSPIKQPDGLWLASRLFYAPALTKPLQQTYKVPVLMVNPFTGMQYHQRVDTALLQHHAPELLTSCGLLLAPS